jgi:hypothetical protein
MTDHLMQALRDPENQPSQYGTVPLETFNKVREALTEAVGWLESVQQDTNYAFDDDYTPRDERVVQRLQTVLAETDLPH